MGDYRPEGGASIACEGAARAQGYQSERHAQLAPANSNTTRTLKAPAGTLLETVKQGEAAVTLEVIHRIRRWFTLGDAAPAHATSMGAPPQPAGPFGLQADEAHEGFFVKR